MEGKLSAAQDHLMLKMNQGFTTMVKAQATLQDEFNMIRGQLDKFGMLLGEDTSENLVALRERSGTIRQEMVETARMEGIELGLSKLRASQMQLAVDLGGKMQALTAGQRR